MRKNPAWDYDAAVIGAGPGGLVAALYLARFRRKVCVFGYGKPRASWIPKSHNIVGFDKGISGPALLKRLRAQVAELGVPVLEQPARLERLGRGWQVTTPVGAYSAKMAVLATGMEDSQPELANLSALRRTGRLRYCPVCDAYEFRDAKIFVLITDEGGITRARFLRRYSKKVDAILVREKPPTSGEKRMASAAGLKLLHGRKISAESLAGGLSLILDGASPRAYQAGYVEMGCRVRDEAFRHLRGLRRTKAGFLITGKEQRLSVPGLFAVGDCVHSLGQVSVAAGQAAIAACAIHGDLLMEERRPKKK